MLTCKEYAEQKKQELKEYISEKGLKPCLVVIQVGDRPESNSYIRGKVKDCEEVGIYCNVDKLDTTISQRELEETIIDYNWDKDVHGIILQLPVPDHIDVKRIQSLIDPKKDVDGFGILSPFNPCTPAGVIGYLKAIDYKFEGKDALVIGRSDIVGKPLARMLTDLDCTVTLAHSKSRHIYELASWPDIIFTCINKIEYFDNNIVNTNEGLSDIIDIGLGTGSDGKLHGNLKESTVKFIRELHPESICISGTGGVGLLTCVTLLENVVKACDMQAKTGFLSMLDNTLNDAGLQWEHEFLGKMFNVPNMKR